MSCRASRERHRQSWNRAASESSSWSESWRPASSSRRDPRTRYGSAREEEEAEKKKREASQGSSRKRREKLPLPLLLLLSRV